MDEERKPKRGVMWVIAFTALLLSGTILWVVGEILFMLRWGTDLVHRRAYGLEEEVLQAGKNNLEKAHAMIQSKTDHIEWKDKTS